MLLSARLNLRVDVKVEPGGAWMSAITPEAVHRRAVAKISAFFIVFLYWRIDLMMAMEKWSLLNNWQFVDTASRIKIAKNVTRGTSGNFNL